MTSDERREVAARLRENANKHGAVLDYPGSTQVASWWLLLHTIGCNSNEQEVAFNMLADLIDPTCHDLGGEEAQPNYCPNCGARLVIERHLVDGDYECVCRYILGRRRAMADLVDPVARPVPVLASDDVNCPHCGTRIDWEEE